MQWLSAVYPLTAWHLALLQHALVQLLGQRRLPEAQPHVDRRDQLGRAVLEAVGALEPRVRHKVARVCVRSVAERHEVLVQPEGGGLVDAAAATGTQAPVDHLAGDLLIEPRRLVSGRVRKAGLSLLVAANAQDVIGARMIQLHSSMMPEWIQLPSLAARKREFGFGWVVSRTGDGCLGIFHKRTP